MSGWRSDGWFGIRRPDARRAVRPSFERRRTCGLKSPSVTATTPRLLLVDGHSLAYRAFFALPVENFSTSTGQPTNAVYGFTSMLVNVLRDEQPTHVAVAFDVSRRSFRTEQYADYKAGRAETPADFAGQVTSSRRCWRRCGSRWWRRPGYEADDVIATLAGRPRGRDGGPDQHRRPGHFPARRRRGHRAVRDPRGLRAGADGPGGGDRQVRGRLRSVTGTWPRWSASRATTSPGCRGWAPRPPPSGSQIRVVGRHLAQADKIKGKAAKPARPPRRRDAQLPAQPS